MRLCFSKIYADFPTQTRTLAQWLAPEELEGQQASVLCLMHWSYTELRKTQVVKWDYLVEHGAGNIWGIGFNKRVSESVQGDTTGRSGI